MESTRLRRWAVEMRLSYFLEFMYVDNARDFVGVVLHVLLDGAKGFHNHWDGCCFEPPCSLNFDFQYLVSVTVVPRAPITTGTVVVLSPHVRSTSISSIW